MWDIFSQQEFETLCSEKYPLDMRNDEKLELEPFVAKLKHKRWLTFDWLDIEGEEMKLNTIFILLLEFLRHEKKGFKNTSERKVTLFFKF